MRHRNKLIDAACRLFVCRVCRTKTGWTHQNWCDIADNVKPDCGDCIYSGANKKVCKHPALKRKKREAL